MNWLLLRGLARTTEHWGDFPKLLLNQPQVQRVECINLPGLDSDQPQTPLSISEITDLVRGKFLSIKEDQDWSIMAISLGAMVALDWCSRYPEDFKRIVTINTSSSSGTHLFQRISPLAIKTFIKASMQKKIKDRERDILKLTTSMVDINEELLEKWADISKNKKLLKLALTQILAAARFKLPKELNTPLLVLASKGDKLAHYSCSEKLAHFYQAKLALHPKAGHDLPLDDPQWILNII